MDKWDEFRLRLGRADQDEVKAWSDATGLARRLINSRATGPADEEALRLMAESLEHVRTALDELVDVVGLLSREVTGRRRRLVRPHTEEFPCASCGKADALVKVTVCVRCSRLGQYA